MYVDGGSALEILYEHCFNRLCLEIKNQMVPTTASLIGFSGEIIWPLGKLSLLVKIGDEEHSTSAWMNFVVVRSSSPYNGIIERSGVRKIQAVSSTAHRMIKFHVAGGVLTLRGIKIIPIECTAISGPEEQPPAAHQAIEERIKVAINLNYPEQTIMIRSTLTEEGRNTLCDLLQHNLDVFAWKPADMTGVPRHIAEHRLNIREGCLLIRQKRRSQAADRNQAIQEEVEKLVDVGIMKEVHYHSWLSNPVMVKKHDGSWRMCVDLKDLNKACPKDGYPLLEIDWKVESLCGFPFKCFLNTYKGYHQIKMAKEDEEKTAFITSQRVFCYSKMPFNLRNVGATYQRLVDKAFHKQIGRNLEVYVDDLVIKSRTEDEIIRDIEETFKTLREINIKLSPKKCTFGVEEEMFLGYKVNRKGIKCTKKSDFHWTKEARAAFKQIKQLIPHRKKKKNSLSTRRQQKKSANTHNPEGTEFTYALRIRFKATNNEAEYEALIAGLRIVEETGVKNLQANVDSKLVANQVNRTYIAKETDMIWYLEKVRTLTSGFRTFSIKQVPRSENKKADALSKIASTSFAHLSKQVLVKELKEKLINELAVVEEEGDTWMTSIYEYLIEEILPAEVNKARAVLRKSQRFTVINGILYKKSFLGPWLRCVRPLQANYVLREIHEGSCSMHVGTRSVVAKALRTGYYWPTMHKDARALIRACQDCSSQTCPKKSAAKVEPNHIPMTILQVGN
ncbi:reverse transcriptase domain-containing protein [Tanacetum coccineum]